MYCSCVHPEGIACMCECHRPDAEVDHPPHYGGADNPHEAIKCIRAHELGFNLGNVVKYVFRAEHKGDALQDLKKAMWYLKDEIAFREKGRERQ